MTLKRALGCITAAIFLQGCVAGGGNSSIGPTGSSEALKKEREKEEREKELLGGTAPGIEVVIPLFDPNLPEDPDKWEKQGIWSELRRAEATRFALRMKHALQETHKFGAVRVVPNSSATGDLYVLGKIERSTGEDVGVHIRAVGIDGKVLLSKTFKHRVKEHSTRDLSNKEKDTYEKDLYEPVFTKAAKEIVKKLRRRNKEYLKNLRTLTEVRFGHSLSEESFSPFLQQQGEEVKLVAAPADTDAMLQRTRQLRVKDQLFIDRLQLHYDEFDGKLSPSYAQWQEAAFFESKARREAKKKAAWQAGIGALTVVIGVAIAVIEFAIAASGNSSDHTNYSASAVVVGAGAYALSRAYETNEEAKFHYETLMELGQSLDTEIAPHVVAFKEETVELTGSAKEQFDQWRELLKRMYAEEKVPEIQL